MTTTFAKGYLSINNYLWFSLIQNNLAINYNIEGQYNKHGSRYPCFQQTDYGKDIQKEPGNAYEKTQKYQSKSLITKGLLNRQTISNVHSINNKKAFMIEEQKKT